MKFLAEKVVPAFDAITEAQKLPLLMLIAEMSVYSLADEARVILPAIYDLFCSHVPTNQTDIKINYTHIECLLYIFHQLASKAPGSLKNVCGIKIMTGQPSDYEGNEEEMEKKRKDL